MFRPRPPGSGSNSKSADDSAQAEEGISKNTKPSAKMLKKVIGMVLGLDETIANFKVRMKDDILSIQLPPEKQELLREALKNLQKDYKEKDGVISIEITQEDKNVTYFIGKLPAALNEANKREFTERMRSKR